MSLWATAVRKPGSRFAAIDLARGVAIAAMVVYHTAYDLSAARLIPVSVVNDPGWRALARVTAGSFLLLVGISLVLATRGGLNRAAYLRRLALVAVGAALVSLATWFYDPGAFVFFGILHEIAVASVLALPFLRLPSSVVAAVAAVVIVLPQVFVHPFFNAPALWWVGLSSEPPVTVDYVPIFPWFGVVLAGIVVGRLFVRYGVRQQSWQPENRAVRAAMAAGRWSLPIYLAHQPILVGAVALLALAVPPGREVVRANWTAECHATCVADGEQAEYCASTCGCVFDGIYGTDLYPFIAPETMNPEQGQRWSTILARCVAPAAD